MQDVLGRLDGLNGRLAGRIDQLRERLLARSGVAKRHFAIDPETGQQTQTNAVYALAVWVLRGSARCGPVGPDGAGGALGAGQLDRGLPGRIEQMDVRRLPGAVALEVET